MKSKIFLLSLLVWSVFQGAMAQSPVQNIRGRVVDKDSKSPLPGANIIIPGSEPLKGTTTDVDGYFVISEVEVGRVNLEISMMGYNKLFIPNLVLNSGKELNLNFEMEEQVIETGEVVVKASANREQVNEMATLSARTFTVEETQRYAGARNDVSRMAANYAGVGTSNDSENSIVIRGNSPSGLLWRFEDVDIPNPNHFGSMGATGGPVSMLNNNVLSNSGFYTAAFPAEYGNALSGVFDLKMRPGNYERHEFLAQVGFNGFELGAEGPLSRKSKATYLVNFRYSTMELVTDLGLSVGTGTAIPKYKDYCFKVNWPLKDRSNISLFGLGGFNSIDFIRSQELPEDSEENMYGSEMNDMYLNNNMGVTGLSYTKLLDNNTYVKLLLSASTTNNKSVIDTFAITDRIAKPYLRSRFSENRLEAKVLFNKKLNAQHLVKAGVSYREVFLNLLDSVYVGEYQKFVDMYDMQDNFGLAQAFAQWQYRSSDNLILNAGIHSQLMTSNNNFSVGPRLGLKWELGLKQSLNFGYGLHSQTMPLLTYFQEVEIGTQQYEQVNKDLDFVKSHHFVVGYEWLFTPKTRLKIEPYYQYVFNAGIEKENSSYSTLNAYSFAGHGEMDPLKNGGTGTNYGVDLTVERFLENNFYYLFTTSLYQSEYKGSDKQTHATAYNGHFVVNALAGKDFRLFANKESNKKQWFSCDLKITAAGGQRYTPIDVETSQKYQRTVYDNDNAFTKQFSPYFRADIRLAYRRDGQNISQELVFDIQNFTNHENPLYMEYNIETGQEEFVNQMGFYPMFQYRIVF